MQREPRQGFYMTRVQIDGSTVTIRGLVCFSRGVPQHPKEVVSVRGGTNRRDVLFTGANCFGKQSLVRQVLYRGQVNRRRPRGLNVELPIRSGQKQLR